VGHLTRVGNQGHRLIRQLTPGPYTFILTATSMVPRSARTEKKHTIGVRIPDHPLVQALLNALDEPMLGSSLILPDPTGEILDSEDLYDEIHGDVDLFVDAGYCPLEPTTLLDLTGNQPEVLRVGAGVIDFL
jgi:tRNA threonylcarbamoyl adenosine modification protein (Sua5/YciO/YrdC/YwlC family)